MRGRAVSARVWRADVGRVQLYLLDTNVSENSEVDRLVTGHLYGGGRGKHLGHATMLGPGGRRYFEGQCRDSFFFYLNESALALFTIELVPRLLAEDRGHL